MIVVLEKSADSVRKNEIIGFLEKQGFKVREIIGEKDTVLGAVGNVSIDIRSVEVLPGVSRVIPITKPYKLASRELKQEDTEFNIGSVKIGGNRLVVIGGPCAVESREQMMKAARSVAESGGVMLRGGAFKPRTSPYSFQGLGEEGLKYLREAGDAYKLPVVTEVVSTGDVKLISEYVHCFQIGARNMQNFELLKEVGKTEMPVILKRGLSATIEEWLMAAEYLLSAGTEKVILCERGIRTFETYTRNTLDLSAIPIVRKLSHLPVIVDPSHGTGLRGKVSPMALAAVAAGAHGLIIEMHPDPDNALSDGAQSLYPAQFEKLVCDVEALVPVLGKELARIPRAEKAMGASEQKVVSGDFKVAFQGERGAYSEQALKKYFSDKSPEPIACPHFADVFKAVLSGKVNYGMVPIENSLAGSVYENFDLLAQYPDIVMAGEIKIRIRHHLMAVKGATLDSIKSVYSHPQALSQCDVFLTKKGYQKISHYDTAGAGAFVAGKNDIKMAAIASEEAATFYGLDVLDAGVETNPRNFTRFALIKRDDGEMIAKADKMSLVFSIPDKKGSLSRCLAVFAEHDLNLTKLESRPILGKPWSYMFYLDAMLSEEGNYQKACDELKKMTEDFRILGVYQSGE